MGAGWIYSQEHLKPPFPPLDIQTRAEHLRRWFFFSRTLHRWICRQERRNPPFCWQGLTFSFFQLEEEKFPLSFIIRDLVFFGGVCFPSSKQWGMDKCSADKWFPGCADIKYPVKYVPLHNLSIGHGIPTFQQGFCPSLNTWKIPSNIPLNLELFRK